MATRKSSRQGGGGGCALVIAGLIVLVIAMWLLSSIGHVLGLTPAYNEISDQPDGWVTDHYQHVVWGYVLTVAVLAAAAVLAWLAVRGERDALARGGVVAGVLLVVVLTVPVGPRAAREAAARAAARAKHVPDVVGLTAAKALGTLGDAGLDVRFRHEPAATNRCRVFAQDPGAGVVVEDGADVKLRCRAHVPRVVARRPFIAEGRIEDAGFRVTTINPPGDGDDARCRVRRQSRSGLAEPDALVRLRLKCRPKSRPESPALRESPPAEACDPSYAGACLDPTAADYDCAGGSGDGPKYTGPVQVAGDDHYDLDRDGDGLACESS